MLFGLLFESLFFSLDTGLQTDLGKLGEYASELNAGTVSGLPKSFVPISVILPNPSTPPVFSETMPIDGKASKIIRKYQAAFGEVMHCHQAG